MSFLYLTAKIQNCIAVTTDRLAVPGACPVTLRSYSCMPFRACFISGHCLWNKKQDFTLGKTGGHAPPFSPINNLVNPFWWSHSRPPGGSFSHFLPYINVYAAPFSEISMPLKCIVHRMSPTNNFSFISQLPTRSITKTRQYIGLPRQAGSHLSPLPFWWSPFITSQLKSLQLKPRMITEYLCCGINSLP